jgi:hypothetical protein
MALFSVLVLCVVLAAVAVGQFQVFSQNCSIRKLVGLGMKNLVFDLECLPEEQASSRSLVMRASFVSDDNKTSMVYLSALGGVAEAVLKMASISSDLKSTMKTYVDVALHNAKVERHIAARSMAHLDAKHTSSSQDAYARLAFGIVSPVISREHSIGAHDIGGIMRNLYVQIEVLPKHKGSVEELLKKQSPALTDLEYVRLMHGYFHDQVVFFSNFGSFHADCHWGNILYKEINSSLSFEFFWSDFGSTATSRFSTNTTHLFFSIDKALEDLKSSLGSERALPFYDQLEKRKTNRTRTDAIGYVSGCLGVMEEAISSLPISDLERFDAAVGGPVAFRLSALGAQVKSLSRQNQAQQDQLQAQQDQLQAQQDQLQAQQDQINFLLAEVRFLLAEVRELKDQNNFLLAEVRELKNAKSDERSKTEL